MDATNTNKMPGCYRDFYLEEGTRRKLAWAHKFDARET